LGWLVQRNKASEVFSIEKVGTELRAGNDDLSTWADARSSGFFLPPGEDVLPAFAAVSNWASSKDYEQAAISTFLGVADYFLVAQALAGKHTVVTHEKPSTTKRQIKIPDACIGLKVKCMTPFEMLRAEKARFVLKSS
jgi:hypothetical protein